MKPFLFTQTPTACYAKLFLWYCLTNCCTVIVVCISLTFSLVFLCFNPAVGCNAFSDVFIHSCLFSFAFIICRRGRWRRCRCFWCLPSWPRRPLSERPPKQHVEWASVVEVDGLWQCIGSLRAHQQQHAGTALRPHLSFTGRHITAPCCSQRRYLHVHRLPHPRQRPRHWRRTYSTRPAPRLATTHRYYTYSSLQYSSTASSTAIIVNPLQRWHTADKQPTCTWVLWRKKWRRIQAEQYNIVR